MEFLEDSHTYINDLGIIVPSVTQVIDWYLGSSYGDIPEDILRRKAAYGTRVHALIENYINGVENEFKNTLEKCSVDAFKMLEAKLPSPIVQSEQKLCNHYMGGTLDILLENGEIADNKTYATVDDKTLLKCRWQLSFYYLLKGYEKAKGYILHIPKNMKYHLYTLDTFSNAECMDVVKKYYEAHNLTLIQ